MTVIGGVIGQSILHEKARETKRPALREERAISSELRRSYYAQYWFQSTSSEADWLFESVTLIVVEVGIEPKAACEVKVNPPVLVVGETVTSLGF
jgi:hypothetical protein